MAVGNGTIISYTDSIPIVAIIFKLFRNILPQTFQYFGFYILLSYVLQSVAAFKIINMKTKNNVYSGIGTFLFSFSPILMERAFRHSALASHWLILFSIYLYLKHCEIGYKKIYIWYLLLEVLAIGIHPYFLPMVAAFAFLCAVRNVFEKKYIAIMYLLSIQGITYLFGVIIGVLGSGVNLSRWGYGYYSMNMNAIINPTSVGGYTWSSVLKTRPLILGNLDGFNYLGLGVLVFGLIDVLLILLLKKRQLVMTMVRQHIFLLMICIFLTIFSLSNVITYNDNILLTIPFPQSFITLCGIFRASSRLFYPVYYIILFFLILVLWKILSNDRKRYTQSVLAFMVVLQLLDISGVIVEKHNAMNAKKQFVSYIEDPTLQNIAEKADNVLLEDYSGEARILAVYAFKHGMSTYYTVANSGHYNEASQLTYEILMTVKQSGKIEGNLIVTTNREVADVYKQFADMEVYEAIEDNYFIFARD